MVSEKTSTLENEEGDKLETSTQSLSYDDVDINLTAGYKPTIVVSLIVVGTLVVFGGVIPGFEGDAAGITTMTYTVVVWGIIVGSLGFVYEYWLRLNQRASEGET
ncbi:hypothetical protein [Halalkalicoccus ordinarius]|uniref:hypothetical protein n=1 Tax=Halalkalicoccus ordinarius TaxID=3116651 RepID=UPI00300F48E0